MLDAVIDYLPSPLDIPAIKGVTQIQTKKKRPASDEEPFAALAFKIMTDPFVGRLTFFRVYSGVLQSGSYVLNTSKGKRERIGRILQMHANSRKEIDTVYSGDIAAAVGLKDTTTGDSLTDEKAKIILESIEVPEPVIQLMVEPKSKADQDKMGIALQNWLKKIQHSALKQTLKLVKQLSLVWVNFTLTSLLTVCVVSSKLKRT